ncbi:uncharacterized protein LOC120177399 [Hibiscus syriacus]|uniref:uncharacterized protein LOC120177399 n=1 Tax=Hibiscus syriacus TaxID=106335 RepID=UPI0019229A81|nr:uncharacterized protein LOC120177399 [Hibiscus syriacus]
MIVLYSNRAQCHLLLKTPAAAISDTTRALCLSGTVSPHRKSLWRRSQAYDMKGLGKESLMDCLMFINTRMKSEHTKRVRIPYYAARMINKQMNAALIFANAKSKLFIKKERTVLESESKGKYQLQEMMMMRLTDAKDKGYLICQPLQKTLKLKREGRRRWKKQAEGEKTSSGLRENQVVSITE